MALSLLLRIADHYELVISSLCFQPMMLQVVEDSFNFPLVGLANLHAGHQLVNQLSQAFCYDMLTSVQPLQMKTLLRIRATQQECHQQHATRRESCSSMPLHKSVISSMPLRKSVVAACYSARVL